MQPPISTAKPVLKLFAIEDLIGAPFNPTRRTEKEYLAVLRTSILALGFVAYPPIVSADGRILDGHRRIAVLKSLGVSEVWCLVVPTGLIETFVAVNTSFMSFTGRDWAAVFAAGVAPDAVSGKPGKRAASLLAWGGPDIFAELTDNRLGIGIVDVVSEVARATGLTDTDGRRRVLRWLIDFDGQRRAREALASDARAVLRLAIERGLPLKNTAGRYVVVGLPDFAQAIEVDTEPEM